MATSGNPAFSNDMLAGFPQVYGVDRSTTMTVQGTVGKTFVLLAILSATAIWSWNATSGGQMQMVILPAAAIGGMLLAFLTIFKPTLAPWTAPIYAAFEGVFLGMLSYLIEHKLGKGYQGIAIQAVALTCGTLFCMLFAYTTRLIRVTERLRAGIVVATGGIALVYLVSFVMSFFGASIPFIQAATPMGIGFSVLVVGVAAFNLLLDFDFIERATQSGAPKRMEWYGAFGLMVTLVWLYLEILRLLRKLQDSRS